MKKKRKKGERVEVKREGKGEIGEREEGGKWKWILNMGP